VSMCDVFVPEAVTDPAIIVPSQRDSGISRVNRDNFCGVTFPVVKEKKK
jgi:hypothetical protein